MTVYVPNQGEQEALFDILVSQGITLALYGNLVNNDGALTTANFTELTTGGGRGYAPIALTNNVVFSGVPVADKWAVGVDSNGKAYASYDDAVQQWVFTAVDVADASTAYGVFGYSWQLPFDTGLAAGANLLIGATVTGATSTATGVVTSIRLVSGTWAGTAAGYLCLKTKTGTFQDNEAIQITGPTTIATTNTGANADAIKKLRFMDAFTTPQLITPTGFTIQYPVSLTLTTA